MDDEVDQDDLADWWRKPVEERVIATLGHVMLSLRDLPVFACDRSVLNQGSIWFPAYLACVEAFFVNARLAAEFFVRMPQRDFTARMFLPDWTPPQGVGARLERVWWMASKHIVHMSKERVPETPGQWEQEDLSYRALMRINRDAHKALEAFVKAYAGGETDSPYADEFRDMQQGCRPFSVRETAALHGPERRAARRSSRHVFKDPYAAVWWG